MTRRHGFRVPPPARALGAVVGAALLAGCAQPLPTPSPEPVPATPSSSVTPEQAEDVLAAMAEAVAAADAAKAVDPAATRVTGPAATLRTAEYTLAAAGAEGAVTPLPEAAQTIVTTATDEWPRTMVVVTEPPADLQAPLLLTLVQEGPRDPYRLWAWVRLFPGTQMPPTAQPEVGNAPVPPDSTDVLVPPAELMQRYVDVLTNGDASPHAGLFGADPLRENLTGLRQAYAQTAANGGTVTESIMPLEEGPVAIGTADGGAIVTGGFRLTISIALQDSTLTVDPATAAFLGGATTLASSLELTFVGTVAFDVPPAGSDEQVTLLGGEFSLTGATGA
ncbi:hypothetical protein [Actinotalea sp. Marseille-Q4924]|uniref:hypothetical protein n=1 Tax=Actinotalea sp. Marseille-Q4924 TaxID=2866571 RepID=UPI001CE499D6|nr:hypothetical protein [Actinotalea sp. Marseille-Q4924]